MNRKKWILAVLTAGVITGSQCSVRAEVTERPPVIAEGLKNYAIAASGDGTGVNIRSGAGSGYEKLGLLTDGGLCYIRAREGDWYRVESGEISGYVKADLMLVGEEAWMAVHKRGEEKMELAEPISEREELVEYACQFVGNPYVWGGESLTEGADCSGFVMKIFEAYGITLPHSSREQADYGTRIGTEEARPGDLIFYERDGTIYHVMIYIGGGQAVHASGKKTGIRISDVQYEKAAVAVNLLGS